MTNTPSTDVTTDTTPDPEPRTLSIEIEPGYNRARTESERSNWRHLLVLETDKHIPKVHVVTLYGSGVPMDLYHGLVLSLGKIPDGVADTSALVEALDKRTGHILTILDGHKIDWDGRNHVGRLDTEASEELDRLQDDLRPIIESLPRFWKASDWLNGTAFDALLGVLGEPFEGTDAQFEALAASLVAEGLRNGAHLDKADVEKTLRSMLRDVQVEAVKGICDTLGYDFDSYDDPQEEAADTVGVAILDNPDLALSDFARALEILREAYFPKVVLAPLVNHICKLALGE